MEGDASAGAGRGAGRGSRLGSLASDVPSSRLGKLRAGLGDVALRAAPADGQRASDAAGGGGALSSAPKPGQSRLGGVASPPPGAAAAAGAPGADAPSQPRKPQFVPKVPVERPRAAAARDTGGQRGDAAAAPDEQRGNRQLQELIRQTEADAARVDARKGAGRGRGRGVAADAPPPVASLAPVTLGAAAGAPRAASAPTGDEKVTRRGRPARAQEEARPAFAAVAMDVDDEDDAVDEHKPRDPIAWLDKQRYYPTVLPFAAPLEDASATPAAGTSPLADLGLVDGTPDGRLLLVQLPALVPVVASAAGSKADGGSGGRSVPLPIEALDDGLLGQLIVYASGAAKLRVGDVMFDVMPGAALTHSEQVAALNIEQERCGFLGAAASRVVITPDVDSLLSAV